MCEEENKTKGIDIRNEGQLCKSSLLNTLVIVVTPLTEMGNTPLKDKKAPVIK